MKQRQQTVAFDIHHDMAPSTSHGIFNSDGLPHVLEASNLTAKISDDQLNDTLTMMGFENVWTKRVDDTRALVVFPSGPKGKNLNFLWHFLYLFMFFSIQT